MPGGPLSGGKSHFSQLVKNGIVNRQSALYKAKCKATTYYPFSLLIASKKTCAVSNSIENREADRAGGKRLAHEVSSGRIELIATSLEVLEGWLLALNALAS